MTHVDLRDLQERRRRGEAPQGGPLPESLYKTLITSKLPEGLPAQLRLLDQLFDAAAKYPNDQVSLQKIEKLIGRPVAPAEVFYSESQQALRQELSNRF